MGDCHCLGSCKLLSCFFSQQRNVPKSPIAGGRVITSCKLSGNGSTWLNKVGKSIYELHGRFDLWKSSVFKWIDFSHAACKFGSVTLCISNVSQLCVAFVDFWDLQKLFFPFRIFFAAILIFVVLWPNVRAPSLRSRRLEVPLVDMFTSSLKTCWASDASSWNFVTRFLFRWHDSHTFPFFAEMIVLIIKHFNSSSSSRVVC